MLSFVIKLPSRSTKIEYSWTDIDLTAYRINFFWMLIRYPWNVYNKRDFLKLHFFKWRNLFI
ncbi:hypothetical protein CGLO_14644 [Colletotrichum gloeosporioides Cg-14]|uniref:Uncharacterized protein n=1 Tax=Colletotrichum gloeosporioides (strain Cg-14) TaxID=1237896 RepID=T0JT72_COLGC|nr:hypothetical protein CGLO_14644 [Colletotrichum gloeosporioides Cg-14]